MIFFFACEHCFTSNLVLHSRSLWPSRMITGLLHTVNHSVNKMFDVLEIVHNNQNSERNFHTFWFSESRLNSHIDDKEVSTAGFHTIRKDPLALKDTGLLVYINEHASFKCLTRYEEYGVECVWFEVKLKNSSILAGFIYRNPSEPGNWVDTFVWWIQFGWNPNKIF